MTEKEIKLAVHYLCQYQSELAGNTCNDVPETIWRNWSVEERQQFVKEYLEYNGDPDEYAPEYLHIPDFAIVGFLAHKLNSVKLSPTKSGT